jgi:methyl-accepting chemotaxis protein
MINRLSLGGKFRLLISCFAVGFLLFGTASFVTLQQVRVNGPRYQRIITGKDLLADILPPPAYILESYTAVLEALAAKKPEEVNQALEKGSGLRKSFEDRMTFWAESMPSPEMLKMLNEDCKPPALEFFGLRDGEFAADLRAGNREKAESLFNSKMRPLYEKHLAAILKLVSKAEGFAAAEEKEVGSLVVQAEVILFAALGGVILVVIFLSKTVSGSIINTLKRTAEVLDAVARGDFRQRLQHDVDDEIGHMASSVNEMVGSIRSVLLEEVVEWSVVAENQKKALQEKELARIQQKKAETLLSAVNSAVGGDLTQTVDVHGVDAIGQVGEGLGTLLEAFRNSIELFAQAIISVDAASQQLSSVSTEMSATAEETAGQSSSVSAAAEQVARNLQTVAAASEEMTASVSEIAKNASQAAKVATEAVKIAEATNLTIVKLGESSTEIGNVIKLITTIAQQTNLLALNATIEAARAGESGKGFAVVANEVKELAKATANAAEDISHKVETIQADTVGAVGAINQITDVINQINEIANVIALSVEEQTATTNEISHNVSEAAAGGSEIARNIEGVAVAADATAKGVAESQKSAVELSEMAGALKRLVDRFNYKLPAPPEHAVEAAKAEAKGVAEPA